MSLSDRVLNSLPSLMENEREKSGNAEEPNYLNWSTNILVIHSVSGVSSIFRSN